MYWPRLRLTPEESKYSIIYDDPRTNKNAVLRRIYYGQLNFNSVIRQDTETFQISRRSRVFGITASGDVNQVEIQIIDVTGEQITTDFIPLANLIGGSAFDPRSALIFSPFFDVGQNLTDPGFFTGFVQGHMDSYVPFILEPSIVLAPNQTLTFNGRPISPNYSQDLHVSFCTHVWEFPGMPGSPK
jgi:hypothetical protein